MHRKLRMRLCLVRNTFRTPMESSSYLVFPTPYAMQELCQLAAETLHVSVMLI